MRNNANGPISVNEEYSLLQKKQKGLLIEQPFVLWLTGPLSQRSPGAAYHTISFLGN
jgi:hypothetical protein